MLLDIVMDIHDDIDIDIDIQPLKFLFIATF